MEIRIDMVLENEEFGLSVPVVCVGNYEKVTEFGDDGITSFAVYAEKSNQRVYLQGILSDYQINKIQTALYKTAVEEYPMHEFAKKLYQANSLLGAK